MNPAYTVSAMKQTYRKTDVQTHYDGYGYGPSHPAVRVKCYNFPGADQVMAEFNCTRNVAEKAIEFAWDSSVRDFWDYYSNHAELGTGTCLYGDPTLPYFPGYNVEVHSEGRMSGWLTVWGLPDVEEWDAVMLARWRRFEKDVLGDVEYRATWEAVQDAIDANEWAKPYAEQYNHVTIAGKDHCVADLNATYHDAGETAVAEVVGKDKQWVHDTGIGK